MGSIYKQVFEPIRIRGVDFKNRLEMAPPSPNLASWDGKVTTEFVNFFRPIAKGGVAVIHVGNCMIDILEACDEERQLDLGTDDCILPLTRFAEMCLGYGAQPSLEINHNGKDSQFEKTGKAAFSSSSIITPFERMLAERHGREPIPTIEMDHAKIEETVRKYADAALRCKRAGFKMGLIHGGHGNLIAQFASPLFNKRRDEYGGCLENRARFAIEVLDKVRELCGEEFVIEYRISADEIYPDGMRFDQTLKFIELIQHKVDILHVSAGIHDFKTMRNWFQNYMMERRYNVHYAADIKKAFPNKRRAAVVGGGPAGIQALLTLCERGHDVTLFEKADRLGGCIVPGSAHSFKQDMKDYLKYLVRQANKASARILLNTSATRELLDTEGYDALVIAVGSRPVFPSLPGIEKPHVHWAPKAVLGEVTLGKRTVIIGGGSVGVECALHLKEAGKDVSIVEMAPDLSTLMASSLAVFDEYIGKLETLGVPVHLNCKLEEVTDSTVVCRDLTTAETVEFPADTVLLALGMSANHEDADALHRSAPETEVFVVGDALEPGNIARAVMSAFRAAAYI